MTLYTPEHFASEHRATAEALILAYPFATLMTTHGSGELQVTHLPLLLQGQDLVGHVARVNPHWQAFGHGKTVAVFHGPHAYISPRWYAAPAQSVPTWNYATVHVSGTPELLDSDATQAGLRLLTQTFDPAFETDAETMTRMLRGIVGFRLPICRLEATFKMSQNKTPADRASVIGGLLGAGKAEEESVARWMQTHG